MVIKARRPGRERANAAAASTFGSMEPLAKWPSAIKRSASLSEKPVQPLLIGLAKVDGHFFHRGKDNQHIGIDRGGEPGAGPVLIDDRAHPAQVVPFADHRNTAAADGNYHLSGSHQRLHRLFFDNIDGLRRGHHPPIATPGILFQRVALAGQEFGLRCAEE
nr:Uncharacterised protein [Raoultella sp. NCTC 9187]